MKNKQVDEINFEKTNTKTKIILLIISVVVCFSFYMVEAKWGFDLWDEGFLWYGAKRVLEGDAPLRDFMAYDPARYYWTAIIMKLRGGTGVLTLRLSAIVFQVLGIYIAMLTICKYTRFFSVIFYGLVAVLFAVWIFPLYKSYDFSLSIIVVGVVTYLIEKKSNISSFIGGLAIGLVLFFGRNHSLYALAVCAGLLVGCCLNGYGVRKVAGLWGVFVIGFLIGLMPFYIMIVFYDGFFGAIINGLRLLVEQGATNLALPIPWLWTYKFVDGNFFENIRLLFTSIFFTAILMYGILGALCLVWKKRENHNPLLVSSILASIPYTHYAFSRADTLHLAMGVPPFLFGMIYLVIQKKSIYRFAGISTILIASFVTSSVLHPRFVCLFRSECIETNVNDEMLMANPNVSRELAMLRNLEEKYGRGHSENFIAPYWPGAYAYLDKKSPVWEIYPLFPRSENFQRIELERLKKADLGFVLILNFPLDGRDELRYENTHSLITNWVYENFTKHNEDTFDYAYQSWVRNK